MDGSGNISCYGDVCTADSFCDNLSRFCFKCVLWLHTCFTDSHIQRCTRVCKEHLNVQGTTSTDSLAPHLGFHSEQQARWLPILGVVVPCIFFCVVAFLCHKFGTLNNNNLTKVLRKHICRILHIFYEGDNKQTHVKHPRALIYTSDTGTLDISLGDTLSIESLLNEQGHQSPPNEQLIPTFSTENDPHMSTGGDQCPNTDRSNRGEGNYYHIQKPVKEVGDGGLSVHVDGHVLKPKGEIFWGNTNQIG